jgi:hypothetical protein
LLNAPKLSTTLRVLPENLGNIFKDTYVLEFLDLPEDHKEKTVAGWYHPEYEKVYPGIR